MVGGARVWREGASLGADLEVPGGEEGGQGGGRRGEAQGTPDDARLASPGPPGVVGGSAKKFGPPRFGPIGPSGYRFSIGLG